MTQNILFIISLAVFLVIIVYVGLRSNSQVSDADDYILAGRGVGFWMNVVNVISIGFAGTAITLCPYFTMQFGLFGGMFGNFLTAGLFLVYGLVLGKVIRDGGAQTLPEWIEIRFDRKTRNVIAICGIIGMTGILANNIMSIVTTVSAYTGWPSWAILVGSFAVILSFALVAGMWGITTSAFAQMIIGVVIIPTFFFMMMQKYGGFDALASNWPSGSDWVFTGVTGSNYPWTKYTYPGFLASLPTSLGLVFGSSYYWTRMATCRNAKTGVRSFAVGGLLMFIIFYIPLCFVGSYGGAFLKDSFTYFGGTVPPTGAYGLVAATLPTIISILTVIAAIAASISTAATSLIGTTATVSRDVYGRMINKTATQEQKLKATRIIIVLVCILTLIMCAYPGGASTIFAVACAFLVPAAILVLLGAYIPKFNATGALVGALVGLVFMFIFYVLELTGIYALSTTVHIAAIGFVVTLAACIIGGFFGKPKYFAQNGWSVKATPTNRENVKLDDLDRQVLALLRVGHSTMADLVDYMGKDCADLNPSIEKLDRGGYLEREGLVGAKFFYFHITEKGWAAAPAISQKEESLARINLSTDYVTVMQKISTGNPADLSDYCKEKKIGSLRLSAIVCHLARVGYITDNKGINSAKYELTDKGSSVLKTTV